MLKFTILLLCSTALLLSGTHAEDDGGVENMTNVTHAPNTTSSTESTSETTSTTTVSSPTSISSTVSSSTTPSTTITTTVAPASSSTPANISTSTQAPTSTPANISTSTQAPTSTPANISTSTQAPTSTPAPAPTPLPPASTGRWVVNSTDNTTTCIIVQMAIQLEFNYTTTNKTEKNVSLDMPASSTWASGVCGPTEQNLTIDWAFNKTVNNSLLLHFVQNKTTKHYWLHHLEVILPAALFPDINTNASLKFIHTRDQFSTALTSSYRCLKLQSLNLTTETSNTTTGTIKVSDLQFQAFRTDNSSIFGLAEDCSFDTPDIVPIAVGCALAALVVIVLVAYLVGRRRSQARGYLSM